jgi:PPOX class probable F420-dependent enzyme
MEIADALAFIRDEKRAVLATLNPDGSPHLVVVFAAVVDDKLWISTPRTSVKARNVAADPRVTLAFGIRPWVAVAGTATILRDGDLPAKLRRYYKIAAGEHPDWDDYDRAMIAEKRVLIEVAPERAYPS